VEQASLPLNCTRINDRERALITATLTRQREERTAVVYFGVCELDGEGNPQKMNDVP
jgi:hypothetical protein